MEQSPMDQFKKAVDAGYNLIVFPEGTRGTPGQMQDFKSGIGRLLEVFPGLPVVPVFLSGPEKSLPRQSTFPLPVWNHIVVGPPHTPSGPHRDITTSLQRVLADLAESEGACGGTAPSRQNLRPVTIACLGIDGSGKSTLSKRLAIDISATHPACLISDQLQLFEEGAPHDMQPLVTEYVRRVLSRYAKKANSLKHYKLPKMTELFLRDHLLSQVRRWYRPDVVVLDGSPLLNMTAWAALYYEESFDAASCSDAIAILSGRDTEMPRRGAMLRDFPLLRLLKSLRLAHLSLPDMVILVDLDPETACERIASRGEERQVHETREKLTRLRQAYLDVCGVIDADHNVPTAVLSGAEPLDDIADKSRAFVAENMERGRLHGPED
jgi:thymidylate kinase-like protein/acyltransferase-like protein